MNPDTNQFEQLQEMAELHRETLTASAASAAKATLLRPDGSPVPEHWSVFQVGETVVLKGYTFKVAYIGESTLLLEPVGPAMLGEAVANGHETTPKKGG